MAMIMCFECDKAVSDSAIACPSCGFGIAAELEVRRIAELDKIEQQRRAVQLLAKKKKDRRTGVGCLFIFFLVCFVSVCGSIVNSCSESKIENAERKKQATEKIEKQKEKDLKESQLVESLAKNEERIVKEVAEFADAVDKRNVTLAAKRGVALEQWFSASYKAIPNNPEWYKSARKNYFMTSRWVVFKYAQQEYSEGNYVEAIENFKHVLAISPDVLDGENPKLWVYVSEIKIALQKVKTLQTEKKWIEVEGELGKAQLTLMKIDNKEHAEVRGKGRQIQRMLKKNSRKAKRLRKKNRAETEKKQKEELRKVLAGTRPTPSAWDGTYREVSKYLKSTANDPSSIDVESCTNVYSTKNGWLVGCDYRGKNAFGALIRKSNWFTIVQGRVVNIEKASAYNY